MEFNELDDRRLREMAAAGDDVLECLRVLEKTNGNVVGELLREVETFYEFDHCPPGDVYDDETHAQYYYHAHREGEHGHFHTFLREKGMPAGLRPIEQSEAEFMAERDDLLSHLVAISMDQQGMPLAVFTTNRWVTADNWYQAEDVIAMLDHFEIDQAWPSWPANRWLGAMLRLFRPQIEQVIRQRDVRVADWHRQHPDGDVFEDRRLDLASYQEISIQQQIDGVQAALAQRH